MSDEELDSVHRRGLRLAEAAAQNSFHCRSADCLGFCFFEDEVRKKTCQWTEEEEGPVIYINVVFHRLTSSVVIYVDTSIVYYVKPNMRI